MIQLITLGACLVALWRLWQGNFAGLWWTILAGAILTLWTAGTVRTALRIEFKRNIEVGLSSEEALIDAKYSPVVKAWVVINMVVTIGTIALAATGVILSYTEPPL